MKKNWIYWWSMVLLLAGVALVAGCDDDDDDGPESVPPENALAVVQKSWKFSGVADQYVVAVFANIKWTVTASEGADWVKLDKKEGNGNGVFTISVPVNDTEAERTATLTVKGVEDATLLATFTITQEAGALNITSEDNVSVEAKGATVVIDVESDMDYTFEMGDWVDVAAAPAAEATAFCAVTKSKITLNIAPNHNTMARECDVKIKVGDNVKKTIHIEQAAAAKKPVPEETLVIDLEEVKNDTLEILSTGGFLKIKTKGNIGYDCALSAWTKWEEEVQLAAADTELENSMSIRVMPNLEADREATLSFTWTKDGKEEKRDIIVRQKAIEFLFVPVSKFPIAGGEIQFALAADKGEGNAQSILKVELSGDGLVFNNAEAFGPNKVTLFTPNYLSSERKLQVVGKFRYRDYEPVVKLFTLEQEKCPSIKAADAEGKFDFSVDKKAGLKDFTVTLPFEGAKWDARIYTFKEGKETECTWALLTKTDKGFTVNWEENTDETKENLATVKVYLTEAEASNYAYVNFTQAKAPVKSKFEAFTKEMELKATDKDREIIIGYQPGNYYCSFELDINDDSFVTLPEEKDWRVSSLGGTVTVVLTFKEPGAAEREATLLVKLYDEKGGTLQLSETITIKQPAKPAEGEKKITLSQNTGSLNMSGGQPLRIEVTGADDVDWVASFNGSTPAWLEIQKTGSAYFLWFNGRGPSGSEQTLYAIPKGENFDSAKIDSYGKLTVTLP